MAKVDVTIYSRPDCHLCDEAKVAIQAADCAGEYTLNQVNIEEDPTLLERYKNDIPVIIINGVEAFRHRLRSDEFRQRILDARQK